jgi:carbonic anhydrase/acetyltransferase-like protein (isoleucine patch superfamily)
MDQSVPRPLVVAIGARAPQIDPGAWIAPTASIVGDVTLASGASVWYGAVLRADTASVMVGHDTNIQDGAVLHADPGYPCQLGDGVTVGHGAVVHGAKVGSGSLVGMGARILNGARIGERCMVAAGALVPEDFDCPPGVLLVGTPAKVRRELNESEFAMLAENAAEYAENAQRHRASLERPRAEPGRGV